MQCRILGRDPLMRFFALRRARRDARFFREVIGGECGIGAPGREHFFLSRCCEGREH